MVRTSRDLDLLHQGLVSAGVARRFGGPLETGRRTPLDETVQVAARIRTLIELPAPRGEARPHAAIAAEVARS
jgi:mitochondrial fission protein ELM1